MRLGDQTLDIPTALRDERVTGPYRGGPSSSASAPRTSPTPPRSPDEGGNRRLEGTVDLVEELGSEKLVHFHIDAARLSGD